jgi:hypothetical protein
MAYQFLDSKLDRALVAYLIDEGAGSVANCYPALRSLGKELPNITVHTTELNIPDGDAFSGSRVADVEIIVSQAAISGEDEVGRQAFNDLVGGVSDALTKWGQSSDLLCDAINAAAAAKSADSDHSDLSEFGVYGIEPRGESQGFTDYTWEKRFRLRCHVAAVAGV